MWVELTKRSMDAYQEVSTSKPGESLCGTENARVYFDKIYQVSTSKPGESLCGIRSLRLSIVNSRSQPPSLENPFVGSGSHAVFKMVSIHGLNLQAWRIPLWVMNRKFDNIMDGVSQPPSLENPFVGSIIFHQVL